MENILLRWGSLSMRSSTPSMTNHGLGTRNQFGMIFHFTEHKNIALIMSVRDTWSSTIGPSRSTWKSSSNRAFLKSTSLLLKQPPDSDNSMLHRLPSHNTWTLNTKNWVILCSQKTGQYSYPYHFLYSNFMYSIPILNKMIFVLLTNAVLSS